MNDEELIETQLGRPSRVRAEVAVRCELGLPMVVVMPGRLPDGEPFPTSHWLTCPLARLRCAQLEGKGAVAELDRKVQTDPDFRRRFEETHARVSAERAERPDYDPRHGGLGVGGSRGGVKCLHAHTADGLATAKNAVFEEIAEELGTLACEHPCVQRVEGQARLLSTLRPRAAPKARMVPKGDTC